MVSTIIWPLVRLAFLTALVKGGFLWLEESHHIFVDRWVAIMIGAIESMAVQAPAWVGWTLVGGLGLVATSVWELIRYRMQKAKIAGSASKEEESPAFIRAINTTGTRIIGNIFKGNRTRINAEGAENLEAVDNIHWESNANIITQEQKIPVSDAIKYLIEETAWGKTNYPNGSQGSQGEVAAALMIRNAAAYGEIVIHGRREINRGTPAFGRFSQVWEPIKSDYWRTHEFDLTVVLDDTARWQDCETQPENPNDQVAGSQPSYAGLRILESHLKSHWPKHVSSQKQAPLHMRGWDAVKHIYEYFVSIEHHRNDNLDRACEAFEKEALDGNLEVFGRQPRTDKYESIGELFWNLGKIDPLRSEHPDGDGGVATSSLDEEWIGLRVKTEDVMRLWPKNYKDDPKNPETFDPNDREIVQLRSDVKRLVRTLGDYGSPEDQRQDVRDRMDRIDASDHAVWLDDKIAQARVDFVHRCAVAQHVREKDGPTFRTRQERDETLFLLKDAAERIEEGLTGRPIPPPADPLSDDTPDEEQALKDTKLDELLVRDWNLSQAYDYWAATTNERGEFGTELEQAASECVITIWGKRNYLNDAIFESIPKSHWALSRIEMHPVIFSSSSGVEEEYILENSMTKPRNVHDSSLEQYWYLCVTSSEVKKLWPVENT